MVPDQLRDALTSGSHSLWGVENSGRPVIFKLKTNFGQNYYFSSNFKHFKCKIKPFLSIIELNDLVLKF